MNKKAVLTGILLGITSVFLTGCSGTIDPCNGVSCSGHGDCQLAGHLAVCQCDPGYRAEGLSCVLEGFCTNIDCGGHGGCVLTDGLPSCACEDGYHPAGLYCVKDDDPCNGVDCAGHGSCLLEDGIPACQCESGYYPAGLYCLEESAPCAGVDCSGHGFCFDAGGQPACQCDPGYYAEDLNCLPDDPCGDVDCGPYGDCYDAGGQAACQCDPGYHPEGQTCAEDDPCDGVSCGLNAHCELGVCQCDDGYHGDPQIACEIYNSEEERIRQKLVEIAEAELGYCNGDDRPYMLDQPYGWCYDFVEWVYMEANEGLPHLWQLPEHLVLTAPEGWLPKPGDLIKYYFQHYCMVAEVLDGGDTIHTIEGNYNRCVVRNTTQMSEVSWFGTLEEFFQ